MWGCEDVYLQVWGCEDVDQQMRGCEDVDQQMWGCEDVDQQMWGCEDVDQQMWRCEDVEQQMWGCEDVDQQMWGCEDVLQRLLFYEEPFAGALGENGMSSHCKFGTPNLTKQYLEQIGKLSLESFWKYQPHKTTNTFNTWKTLACWLIQDFSPFKFTTLALLNNTFNI